METILNMFHLIRGRCILSTLWLINWPNADKLRYILSILKWKKKYCSYCISLPSKCCKRA